MIRFMLTEVPSMQTAPQPGLEPVIDDLLPWADPYIVKLAQALEMEAREQLKQAFSEELDDADLEAADTGDDYPWGASQVAGDAWWK